MGRCLISIEAQQFPLTILLSLNSILGYRVWFGWLTKFRTNKYPKDNKVNFWKSSLINHVSWLIILPYIFGLTFTNKMTYNIFSTWLEGLNAWPCLIWPLCISMVSLAFMTEDVEKTI